jgi:hypothetical protein
MGSQNPVYKPLATTEFRVIHILPGAFNDPFGAFLKLDQAALKRAMKHSRTNGETKPSPSPSSSPLSTLLPGQPHQGLRHGGCLRS